MLLPAIRVAFIVASAAAPAQAPFGNEFAAVFALGESLPVVVSRDGPREKRQDHRQRKQHSQQFFHFYPRSKKSVSAGFPAGYDI